MKRYLSILVATIGFNAIADCPYLYPSSSPVVIPNTTELCSSFFVVLYDTDRKAAVYTSAVVKADQGDVERIDSFRIDERLPKSKQATNADYVRSGYDRGHLVPAGDATNPEEMRETFRLTNMTPQNPVLNRGVWRELEYTVRGRIMRSSADTVVVTEAFYDDNGPVIGKNKIPVPVRYCKTVYYQSGTTEYCTDNKTDGNVITSFHK